MNWIILILPILLLIRLFNKYRVNLSTLKTQNKLNLLRGELIINYSEKKFNCDKQGVIGLHNLIVGTEMFIPKMNIWVIGYTVVFRNRNISNRQAFDSSCLNCPEFKRIYTQYSEISTKYLFHKSIFSLLALSMMYFPAKHISKRCVKWILSFKEKVRYSIISQNDIYRPAA